MRVKGESERERVARAGASSAMREPAHAWAGAGRGNSRQAVREQGALSGGSGASGSRESRENLRGPLERGACAPLTTSPPGMARARSIVPLASHPLDGQRPLSRRPPLHPTAQADSPWPRPSKVAVPSPLVAHPRPASATEPLPHGICKNQRRLMPLKCMISPSLDGAMTAVGPALDFWREAAKSATSLRSLR
jgi:hypothetical protein